MITILDKFKLRGPRILVRQLQSVTMTASGIFLPGTQTDEQHHRGIIERVGPGEFLPDGLARRPIDLRPGDLVYFAKFAGSHVVLDQQPRLVLMEDEVQGAIDAEHVEVVTHPEASNIGEYDHLVGEPCAVCLDFARKVEDDAMAEQLEADERQACQNLEAERERMRAER